MSCCVLQLLLLENVRFYKEEEKNVAEFAQKVRLPLAAARCRASACLHVSSWASGGWSGLACIDGMKMTLVLNLLHASSSLLCVAEQLRHGALQDPLLVCSYRQFQLNSSGDALAVPAAVCQCRHTYMDNTFAT
jgi:hypothetical protein